MEREMDTVLLHRPCSAYNAGGITNKLRCAPQIRLCWPLCTFINYIYYVINKLCVNSTFTKFYAAECRRTISKPCPTQAAKKSACRAYICHNNATNTYQLTKFICVKTIKKPATVSICNSQQIYANLSINTQHTAYTTSRIRAKPKISRPGCDTGMTKKSILWIKPTKMVSVTTSLEGSKNKFQIDHLQP